MAEHNNWVEGALRINERGAIAHVKVPRPAVPIANHHLPMTNLIPSDFERVLEIKSPLTQPMHCELYLVRRAKFAQLVPWTTGLDWWDN